MDKKSVRMAGETMSDRKSTKSGKSKQGSWEEQYEAKTVEEIELEMDKARDQLSFNMDKINEYKRKSGNMTKTALMKELKPLMDQNKELVKLVRDLDRIRDSKIPDHEKLPKESNFYKHYVSNLYTNKFGQTTCETVKHEETTLREVAESIQKVKTDERESKKFKPYNRTPSKREREASKSLWQELSA